MEKHFELGPNLANSLVEEIIEKYPDRILFDKTDKYEQGRCIVISGPSQFVAPAKGEYALIYICLDANVWGTLTLYRTENAAIKKAKKIIKELEEEQD